MEWKYIRLAQVLYYANERILRDARIVTLKTATLFSITQSIVRQ
jgi:hypothetical protein